ncbi:GATA transcription factor 12-like [Impatiens glandulifera]|uniref:GATA transcription factor 12-like n=1 Tax=Impatiens glandulifera TaxID=253017 RepID=UPI001FB069C7|nr:GATA transcription factor 12-like [Impatiens glandulifera]
MATSEYFIGTYCGAGDVNHFAIDDLLDFSKVDDEAMSTDHLYDNNNNNVNGNNSVDSSSLTAMDCCNSSVSGGDNTQFCGGLIDPQFSGEFCVPYQDMAELEWLSNFVEDSFSTQESQNHHHLQLISAIKATPSSNTSSSSDSNPIPIPAVVVNHDDDNHINVDPIPSFPSDVSVPGKARSKRSRAAPCDWSSRLLVVSPTAGKPTKLSSFTKKRNPEECPGRKCLHCASDKTPQWRTGPMGPKTLCNACGVRYKSGRLVPEYRPAASPTFVSTKHSNSHRKVMELRRQNDDVVVQGHHHHLFINHHHHHQSSIFGISNPEDYLIHHQSWT